MTSSNKKLSNQRKNKHKHTALQPARCVSRSIATSTSPSSSGATPLDSSSSLSTSTHSHTHTHPNTHSHAHPPRTRARRCIPANRCSQACLLIFLLFLLFLLYVSVFVRVVPTAPASCQHQGTHQNQPESGENIESAFSLDLFPFLPSFPKLPIPPGVHSSLNALLSGSSVRPGVAARGEGMRAHHPVVFIPGIVSTALEVWEGEACAKPHFRQRLWGSALMIRSLILDSRCWLRHLSLNGTTGLDPNGIKLRPASGLEAADYLIGNFWVWAKIIEEFSEIGYDVNSMYMAAYDWRLSFKHLQVRDYYFTKLKYMIEIAKLSNHDRKCVIICHSMGTNVFQYFLQWVEHPEGGAAGSAWVSEHIETWVAIGGPMLGVPKVYSTLLSGEMKDSAEIAPFVDYWRQRIVLSQREVLNIMRSFRSLMAMFPKGDCVVWGDEHGAPDDHQTGPEQHTDDSPESGAPSTTSALDTLGEFVRFSNLNISWPFPNMSLALLNADGNASLNSTCSADADCLTDTRTSLNLNDSLELLRRVMPEDMELNDDLYSFGYGAHPPASTSFNEAQRHFANPLETTLPNAPDMKIFCLYGTGHDTERGYVYNKAKEMDPLNLNKLYSSIKRALEGAEEVEVVASEQGDGMSDSTNYSSHTSSPSSSHSSDHIGGRSSTIPLFQLNTSYHSPAHHIRNGVKVTDGDATVPLISLGYMCYDGWKSKRFNPHGVQTIVREYQRDNVTIPIIRSSSSVDHVDIMGNSELIRDLISIVGIRITNNAHQSGESVPAHSTSQTDFHASEEPARFKGEPTPDRVHLAAPHGQLTVHEVKQRVFSRIHSVSKRVRARLERALNVTLEQHDTITSRSSHAASSHAHDAHQPSAAGRVDPHVSWSDQDEQLLNTLLLKKQSSLLSTPASPSLLSRLQHGLRQGLHTLSHHLHTFDKQQPSQAHPPQQQQHTHKKAPKPS